MVLNRKVQVGLYEFSSDILVCNVFRFYVFEQGFECVFFDWMLDRSYVGFTMWSPPRKRFSR